LYGHEPTRDDLPDSNPGRHRGRRLLSPPVALGLTVAALLAAFGVGAAFLPDSITGKGVASDQKPASVTDPYGAGGGDPVSAEPSISAEPVPSTEPTPSTEAPESPAAPPPPPPAADKPKPKPAKTSSKPASKPKPPANPPKVGADMASQEDEVVRLTNVERGKAGCGEVRMDDKLRTAMRLHVQELGTHGGLYISHVSDDGRSFVDRAKAQGYNAPAGENVARGQRDAADVMKSWMNSDGHRKNILNCSHKAIGVGATKGVDGTIVWGQIFGRS
jgi:uncharacterized protein YkwD